MTQQYSIGFIGGGNMATAIISGLLKNKFEARSIFVADPDKQQLAELRTLNSDLNTCSDGNKLPSELEVLVLAVKPQIMQQVLSSLGGILDPKTVVVSIAAGVPVKNLDDWLTQEHAIVRCMPNTPALVGLGASGLFANELVTPQQKEMVECIFNSVGISFWVSKESDIDSIIAVSGSGPAYFFYLMECIQSTALELGLPPETAKEFTLQTALGAATLASTSTDDPAMLRKKVSSKGGTTEAAISTMQEQNFSETIDSAMRAAVNRAIALSNSD